jgi:hypothetical protein
VLGQAVPSSDAGRVIRLVVPARKGHDMHVERPLELHQDIERAIRHATVWRVWKAL